MKKRLMELITDEQISKFNIEFRANEVKFQQDDCIYTLSYGKMIKAFKDGDTITIWLGTDSIIGSFRIFEEMLILKF